MMGWNYGNMMGWGSGAGAIGLLYHTVILADLILVGLWLWKHLDRK